MLTSNQRRRLFLPPKLTDMVEARVTDLPSIPADANPFHHDSFHMGTQLVRGWMAMHEGNANAEDPKALTYLILVNTNTGQRIQLDLSSEDEIPQPVVHLDLTEGPCRDDIEPESQYGMYVCIPMGKRLDWVELLPKHRYRRPMGHYVLVENVMVHARTFVDPEAYQTACTGHGLDRISDDDYAQLRAKVDAFYELWGSNPWS